MNYAGGVVRTEGEQVALRDVSVEMQKVWEWRKKRLYEAGMPFELAAKLSVSNNWRQALDLMKAGCRPQVAFDIAL